MEFLSNIYFNIVDLVVISFILISCIVASYRGFIKEVFSMICWIAALMTAYYLHEKIKIELEEYINQKVIIDIVSFGIPFLIALFISNLISKWLSPKFSLPGLLFFDKLGGFIFGVLRGIFFIVLLYLGFLYLLGKEQKPNVLLEAKTYNYITKTANLVVKLFPVELNYKDENKDINNKENLINQ
ncbi:CvpA family protein [Pseudomonadota bacterium]|nr:CvpA family protein [Pseudomonadota bacterium]